MELSGMLVSIWLGSINTSVKHLYSDLQRFFEAIFSGGHLHVYFRAYRMILCLHAYVFVLYLLMHF